MQKTSLRVLPPNMKNVISGDLDATDVRMFRENENFSQEFFVRCSAVLLRVVQYIYMITYNYEVVNRT